jgi:hypothetical protein
MSAPGLLSEIASDVVVVLSTHIVDDVEDVCVLHITLKGSQTRRAPYLPLAHSRAPHAEGG